MLNRRRAARTKVRAAFYFGEIMVGLSGRTRVVGRSPDRPTSPTAGLPHSVKTSREHKPDYGKGETFGQSRGPVGRPAHNPGSVVITLRRDDYTAKTVSVCIVFRSRHMMSTPTSYSRAGTSTWVGPSRKSTSKPVVRISRFSKLPIGTATLSEVSRSLMPKPSSPPWSIHAPENRKRWKNPLR